MKKLINKSAFLKPFKEYGFEERGHKPSIFLHGYAIKLPLL